MKQAIFRTAILAGLAGAVLCTLYLLLLYAFELNPFGRFKYVYFALYALAFVWGMRHFRDKLNQNRMRAQQGILLGFTLNAAASLTFGILIFAMLKAFPNIIDLHMEQMFTLLEGSKEQVIEQFGQEAYQTAYSELQKVNARDLALDQMFGMLMTGVLHTFLFMLIFKN